MSRYSLIYRPNKESGYPWLLLDTWDKSEVVAKIKNSDVALIVYIGLKKIEGGEKDAR